MSRADKVKCRLYPETAVGGFSRVDGTIEFYTRVNALLRKDMVVVDLGAGRGSAHFEDLVPYRRKLRSLKGRCAKVIGLDVDDVVRNNPTLDEAHVLPPDGRFPVHEVQRVEVITSVQRRRRWSVAEKIRLVEETLQPVCCSPFGRGLS